MKVSYRGVKRFLAELRDEPPLSECARVQAGLEDLVDVVLGGGRLEEIDPAAAAHLDDCQECQARFLELLGDLEAVLADEFERPERIPRPDLSFLPGAAPADDKPQMALGAVLGQVRSIAGRLASLRITLTLPPRQLPAEQTLREPSVGYVTGPASSEILRERPLFTKSFWVEGSIRLKLTVLPSESADVNRVLVQVEGLEPAALRRATVLARSGQRSWKASFEGESGRAVVTMPVYALAELVLDLRF